MSDPFTKSDTFPDASRSAAPPAATTKRAYEIMEINRASIVPLGIALAGSYVGSTEFPLLNFLPE